MNLFDAEQLAKSLIRQYNPGINFAWSRTKNAMGDYSWANRRLRLSKVLVPLMTEEEVINTIKHELAHSMAPAGSGHGPEWQRIMISVFNLPPNRCSTVDIDLTKIKGTWRALCPNGHKGNAVYMRRPTRERSCGKCSSHFDPRYLLTYVRST